MAWRGAGVLTHTEGSVGLLIFKNRGRIVEGVIYEGFFIFRCDLGFWFLVVILRVFDVEL